MRQFFESIPPALFWAGISAGLALAVVLLILWARNEMGAEHSARDAAGLKAPEREPGL